MQANLQILWIYLKRFTAYQRKDLKLRVSSISEFAFYLSPIEEIGDTVGLSEGESWLNG